MSMSTKLACIAILLSLPACLPFDASADATRLGLEALRQGNYQAARDHLQTALRADSAGGEVRGALLRVFRETGSFDQAQNMADSFLAQSESSAILHVEAGRIAAEIGKYARAEKEFRRAIELSRAPGHDSRFLAMRELGLLLEETGRGREAGEIWRALLKLHLAGALRGSMPVGCAAVAAWRLGSPQESKDLFLDATDEKLMPAPDLETLSLFGYLFLEKYRATEAISVFRDCLKINKSFPPALVGLALARQYDDGAQAEQYARAALAVNPGCVTALNFLAELQLQEENPAAAVASVRRALQVNPANPTSLSLEAICKLAAGDARGFAESEARVLGLNPTYGRFHLLVAEHYVSRRKYQEAVDAARRAVALDARLWEAHAALGMNLMRLGDLGGGRESLETAFRGDGFNVWAFNTLELLDQLDKFPRIRSKHFTFLVSNEDEPALAPSVEMLAEEAYDKLTRKYGFQPQGPLQIELFPDHGGFAVRTLGLPGLGALGVCFGKVIAMDSPRARPAGEFNWGSTLWHEMAHVITLQMTNHNIPRWLSEGLSVYEERRARPGWGDDLTPSFVKAFKDGKLLKVSELNAGMMRPRFREQVALSYYQASMVCDMVEEKFGFDAIRGVLRHYASGLSTDEAFRKATGWDGAALDAEFARYLELRMKEPARVLQFAPEATAAGASGKPDSEENALRERLARNPDDFFALVRMGALLRSGKSSQAIEHLRRAQKLFPEFVGAGNPYEILSEMFRDEKRPAEELAELEAWLRFDESALQPLLRSAELRRQMTDWKGVADALGRAIYIYPFDASVHLAYGDAVERLGRWDAAVQAYRVVARMSPADPAEAYYRLARALYETGRKDEAKRETLRALEIAPTYEKALSLLLKLTGKERQP